MKKFTQKEKGDGELAVRTMSEKARQVYDGTDLISVCKYIDYYATMLAEEAAEQNGIDYCPGQYDVVRYAIIDCGNVLADLTFDEAQTYLEEQAIEE